MKYRRARMFALLLLTTILSLGVCGCMSVGKKESFSVDACIEYMNQKYGTKFEYIEPIDNHQPTASSMKIYVSHVDYPDSRILVTAMRKDEGFRYLDNFVAIKYAEETCRTLQEAASAVYGECRVAYDTNHLDVLTEDYDASTSFADYAKRIDADINAMLLIAPSQSPDQKEEKMNALAEQLKAKQIVARLKIYYVSNQEAFESIQTETDVEQWNRKPDKWYAASGLLALDENFEPKINRWG